MTGMVADMEPDTQAMEAAAGAAFSTATDLADWLVRENGLPFRDAHHVTGRIVAEAAKRKVALEDVPLEAMQAIDPKITQAVFSVLSARASVDSRTSFGGTAPDNVRASAAIWLEKLATDDPNA
jgi:argininosuccinate lyase